MLPEVGEPLPRPLIVLIGAEVLEMENMPKIVDLRNVVRLRDTMVNCQLIYLALTQAELDLAEQARKLKLGFLHVMHSVDFNVEDLRKLIWGCDISCCRRAMLALGLSHTIRDPDSVEQFLAALEHFSTVEPFSITRYLAIINS